LPDTAAPDAVAKSDALDETITRTDPLGTLVRRAFRWITAMFIVMAVAGLVEFVVILTNVDRLHNLTKQVHAVTQENNQIAKQNQQVLSDLVALRAEIRMADTCQENQLQVILHVPGVTLIPGCATPQAASASVGP
jgi:hypothetical protein